MAEPAVPVTPSDMAAAVVYYGSERKAASALGISRSTLNGIISGRHGAASATSRAFSDQRPGVLRALDNLAGMIEGSGTSRADQRAEKERLKREEKLQPGSAREQANVYARVLEARNLDVHGNPLEFDSRGRPIRSRQHRAYEQLAANADRLDGQRYARLIAFQERPIQPRSGGRPPVRIVPL